MLAELLVLCCFVSIARSLTFPNVHVKRNITIEALPRSVALRVLPLGDSITNGVGSTDGNGYRDIFVELAEQGGAVQMIGSHAGVGKMSNNQEEGWNGYTIDKISKKATNALEAKPNLVLLLAGTNNMNSDAQERSAPSEMEALIDKVLAGSSRAVLLVGTIIPSTLPGRQARNDRYNAALEQTVASRQDKGKHIMLVPIGSAVQPDELVDGIHPDDAGYQNIAVTWMQGVNDAQSHGWFPAPEPGNGSVTPSSSDSAQSATFGSLWQFAVMFTAVFAAMCSYLGSNS